MPPKKRLCRSEDEDVAHARALGLADLARSGLTAVDAEKLGFEFLTPGQAEARCPGHRQAATLLPYYLPSGKRRPDVFRLRLLEPPPAGAFGSRATEWLRYAQPKGSPCAVYFPPNHDWPAVLADPTSELWITEGEKKAAKACADGVTCLGLGGVWSFGAAPAGVALLPELAAVEWRQRKVYVAFDSDVMVKPDVAKAVARLLEVLVRRGALVRSVLLPELRRGQKCGLDDYLVAEGPGALGDLVGRLDHPLGELGVELWKLNDRYAVIHHPTCVYDLGATDDHGRPQPKPLAPGQFTGTAEADRRCLKEVGDRKVFVSVAQEWLQWPCRQAYEGLTYAPGSPSLIPGGRLNSWLGLAVGATPGDVRPWNKLLDHLFTGAEPEARTWFERWCGYPLARLGTKLLSAVGVWSARTGQGKTLVGETLGRIYGANYVSIPQYELESNFTGWALGRQFVLIDDISSHDTRQRADLLKKLITQREFNVNLKHVPQFVMPDYINYYFTSNHGDAFYLDEHDRRLFIHEVTVEKLPAAFYEEYFAWLSGPGPAALLAHFQALDYGDFSPNGAPPLTAAKEEMIAGVRTELDAWLAGLAALDLGGRELWTSSELCDRFNQAAVGRRVAPHVFGRRLRRYAPCVGLVADATGRQRYYALKNSVRWLKASNKEKSDHVQTAKRF
jgi:hypothetical protein